MLWRRGGLVGAIALALGVWSCERAPDSSASQPDARRPEQPSASLLHDAAELRRAIAALSGPLPKPIRALSLRVFPDRALLQVQDKSEPFSVVQYRYKHGELTGPIAVRLAGTGKLEDNLFPLKYADLNAIARLVEQAESRTGLEGARATTLTLKRNLPASMDIQFEVAVSGASGSRVYVDARKNGKLLRVRSEP